MSFQSVWGFDPDELFGSQKLSWHESAHDPTDQLAAIPPDVDAQIYELRRMFGS
jgi:hypothetical protein